LADAAVLAAVLADAAVFVAVLADAAVFVTIAAVFVTTIAAVLADAAEEVVPVVSSFLKETMAASEEEVAPAKDFGLSRGIFFARSGMKDK
jgi:hypothetical protein